MEYRRLGRSGLEVSVVGIGCNNFGGRIDEAATRLVVDRAIELGVNLFDTADVYGGSGRSEELLGRALGNRRADVVIATKFAAPMGEGPMRRGASRRYIMTAVEDSLRRLGTDYIDLYQVHLPDADTPIEETMRTLDDLVRSGKVRYIGHSNFAGWQIASTHWIARSERLTPFISAQNEYSLLNRKVEDEVAPACEAYEVGILPYFPLASGLLTGKYRRGEDAPAGTRLADASSPLAQRVLNDRNWERAERVREIAESRGHSMLELAIGWLAAQPAVTSVIAGATKPEQVEQNVAAAAVQLDAETMEELQQATRD